MRTAFARGVGSLALPASGILGGQRVEPTRTVVLSAFQGAKAGDKGEVCGITLCWCPAGTFLMGRPRREAERRPGEDQVAVTLTRGFWMARYEATPGQWKRGMGNRGQAARENSAGIRTKPAAGVFGGAGQEEPS
jgi:formylglycine-generating enzyme required for sulfatase activity